MEGMGTWTGRLLGGRYRVGRQIGRGGAGEVYEAVLESLRRPVAIKLLLGELADQGEHLLRFQREAEAAAALNHPNIVQVTDFGQRSAEEPAFIVMEQLEGRSLQQAIEEDGPFDAERIAYIAGGVLDALEAAHGAEIVHRDIKPDNVFLTSMYGIADVVKVLDFGIAKLWAQSATPLSVTGQHIGTPAFMSPEQAYARPVDRRTDIHAVGVLMYYALAGRRPFEQTAFPALLAAIASQDPPPLAGHRPDLDPALVAVVERAMRKGPDERYQSAAEMRAALAPWAKPRVAGAAAVAPSAPNGPVSTSTPQPVAAALVSEPIAASPPRSGGGSKLLLIAALVAVPLLLIGVVGVAFVAYRAGGGAGASGVGDGPPGGGSTTPGGYDPGALALALPDGGAGVPVMPSPASESGKLEPDAGEAQLSSRDAGLPRRGRGRRDAGARPAGPRDAGVRPSSPRDTGPPERPRGATMTMTQYRRTHIHSTEGLPPGGLHNQAERRIRNQVGDCLDVDGEVEMSWAITTDAVGVATQVRHVSRGDGTSPGSSACIESALRRHRWAPAREGADGTSFTIDWRFRVTVQ